MNTEDALKVEEEVSLRRTARVEEEEEEEQRDDRVWEETRWNKSFRA